MKITKVFLYSVAMIYFALAPNAHAQASAADSTESLAYFAGSWHCEGKFTSSGKSISATLAFVSILGGKFLLLTHDDKPPFNYHAWSEWGWDPNARQFVSTTQDSTGGVRLFRSPGWTKQTLEWAGGGLPDSSDQRFVFERLDQRSFSVTYSYNKNGSWVSVDSSLCNRVGTN